MSTMYLKWLINSQSTRIGLFVVVIVHENIIMVST